MDETKNPSRKYEETLSTAVWGSLGFGLGAISLPLILNVFFSLLSIAAESGFCSVKLSVQAGNDLPISGFLSPAIWFAGVGLKISPSGAGEWAWGCQCNSMVNTSARSSAGSGLGFRPDLYLLWMSLQRDSYSSLAGWTMNFRSGCQFLDLGLVSLSD